MKVCNDSDRYSWQNPWQALRDIGLKTGMTFVDVGCGSGFFSLPAAKIVGPEGKVYGVDVNEEAIAMLVQKARAEGLENIVVTAGKAESKILCDACADIVFFGIVLHDFEDPLAVLRNARRMMKPDGRLVNLDWKKTYMSLGPPYEIRFSADHASRLIRNASFRIQSVRLLDYHYVIVAQPS